MCKQLQTLTAYGFHGIIVPDPTFSRYDPTPDAKKSKTGRALVFQITEDACTQWLVVKGSRQTTIPPAVTQDSLVSCSVGPARCRLGPLLYSSGVAVHAPVPCLVSFDGAQMDSCRPWLGTVVGGKWVLVGLSGRPDPLVEIGCTSARVVPCDREKCAQPEPFGALPQAVRHASVHDTLLVVIPLPSTDAPQGNWFSVGIGPISKAT